MTAKSSLFKRFADKLFGGINMSWPKVIVFAVCSALFTAAALIVPFLASTSVSEIGAMFEAWILFAVIIMTNCKKPLESALKTFVFFLISQPLIYLFQVPFYEGGFGIFMYYRYWFFLTLLTFPMAFVGWYLKRRDWLSLLILSPMLVYLALMTVSYGKRLFMGFPDHLIAFVFCLLEILLLVFGLFKDLKIRLAGLAVAVITAVCILIFTPQVDTGIGTDLEGVPPLSESAVISLEDSSFGEAEITDREIPYIRVRVVKNGSTVLMITDGGRTYRYRLETKIQDGHSRVDITPIDE